jgi:hypothetical protein
LRRAVPSFTVEVRRRPRLATTSNQNAQSSETQPSKTAFDPESHRAAAAAFDAQKTDPSPVDVATSRPTGRILPSLVPDEPRDRLCEDARVSTAESEPPPRVPKRPSVRAAKQGEQASKSPWSSSFSSDENAPLAERSSTKSLATSSARSDERADATPKDPMHGASQVVGDARGLAMGAKGRKRSIMARYVFANEDKPGARWKRRLLRSR